MTTKATLFFVLTSSFLLWVTGCGCDPGVLLDVADMDMGTDGDAMCSCAIEGAVCEESQDSGACVCAVSGEPPCGGQQCCDVGQVCEEGACVTDCGAGNSALLCGENSDQCCNAGQACLNKACCDLGAACTLTEECELDEICEPSLGQCVPRSCVEVCEVRPEPAPLNPALACRWRPDPVPAGTPNATAINAMRAVVMTPTVANLTDDNQDGNTNTLDIPDLVFVSFDYADGCCTSTGVVRVVSGACIDDDNDPSTASVMQTHATLRGLDTNGDMTKWVGNSSGVAIANLHPDSFGADTMEYTAEIVATFQSTGTVAWTRGVSPGVDDPTGAEWRVLWQNDAYPTAAQSLAGAQPSVADLNGDGQAEVIIGNTVLNGLTGDVVWDGDTLAGGIDNPTADPGVGNNAFLGPVSTVADIDLDGTPEVIAGNTVYDGVTGAEIWTYTYTTSQSICQGSLTCDGYNAVGNFDADDEGEVVIVREGEIFVINHDGTLLYQATIPWDNCIRSGQRANESGPPTIADFDGDGKPEIGTAGADYYAVIDFDCVDDGAGAFKDGDFVCDDAFVRWKVTNQDCSSRATGSSVFDFEGDGKAEVVYADENSFRIFAGYDGEDLSPAGIVHSSNTRVEMPIVADIDNDGRSEFVIPEPHGTTSGQGGIEIWEDPTGSWVRTRRIWNQHSYHVSNISEDGQVPRYEAPNWLNSRLNNFRQNVQPGGLFDAPDLFIPPQQMMSMGNNNTDGIRLSATFLCGDTNPTLNIQVIIANRGALGTAPGVPVYVELEANGVTCPLDVQYTSSVLLPGQEQTFTFAFPPTTAPTAPFDCDPDTLFTGDFNVNVQADSDGTAGSSTYAECVEDNDATAMFACTIVE